VTRHLQSNTAPDRRLPGDRVALPLDLIRHVEVALDVAGRALDLALADDNSPGPDTAATDPPRLTLSKVVAETTMLLRVAAPLGRTHPRIARTVTRLIHRIAPLARGEALLALLCREPSLALDRAAAHLHLRDLGHDDPGVDRLLAMALHAESAGSPERLPNHELEHEWLRAKWNRSPDRAQLTALLARTCAGGPIDALGATTADLYALTHVVLYATDMGGAHPVAWPRPLAELAADAEAGLAAALDADNFDLAAELLWTWPMLRMPWSPIASFGFDVVAAAADEHGFVPGPGYRHAVAERLPGPERERYALRTSYHATYVFAFAAAVAAHTGCVPANDSFMSRGPRPPASSPVVDDLLHLARDSERAPTWLHALESVPAPDRSLVADLLVTTALRRAFAANDLAGVRRALQTASEGDLLRGPAVRQAVALLKRAAILAAHLNDRAPNATLVGRDCA
jgi:hypothetical protein